MILQGKAKAAFNLYLVDTVPNIQLGIWSDHNFWFDNLDDRAKWGFIQAWGDSVEIIMKDEFKHRDGFNFSISYRTKQFNPYKLHKAELKCVYDRGIMQSSAILKLNEIFNSRK